MSSALNPLIHVCAHRYANIVRTRRNAHPGTAGLLVQVGACSRSVKVWERQKRGGDGRESVSGWVDAWAGAEEFDGQRPVWPCSRAHSSAGKEYLNT
eukprot:232810-Chlamydomonas_euryale.AAC.7